MYKNTTGLPGPRDPWLTPYMVPWSEVTHSGKYRRTVAVTSAQSGKSETMLDLMGARVDQRPAPILYVGPTMGFLTDVFEPRLQAMIDDVEALRSKVPLGKRQKKTLKRVNGVSIRMAHAGSSSALKSDPAALALIDEYDEMMANVKGQGEVLGLVEARGETYADFVTAVTSTPSNGLVDIDICDATGLEFWAVAEPDDVESPIWRLFQGGTRHHFVWPCKHCRDYFVPRFKQLRWPEGVTPTEAKEAAYVECPRCGGVLEEEDKSWLNSRGAMVAPGQSVQLVDDAPQITGEHAPNSTYSTWTSGLCSPFVSFGQRAESYLVALNSGDHNKLQTSFNANFGECYSAISNTDAPDWQYVLERRLPYSCGTVPEGALRLVMGVDVQKMMLYYVIRAFGARGTSWLIENGEIHGPTSENSVWEQLAEIMLQPIDGHGIAKVLIDSGYRPDKKDSGDIHKVYAFCRQYSWLCSPAKGYDRRAAPYSVSKVEVKKDGKKAKRSVDLVNLSTDFFKSLLVSRLNTPMDQVGAFFVHQDVDENYCKQITSEYRDTTGKAPVWVKRRRDNHLFDCESLCMAAGYALNVHRIAGDMPPPPHVSVEDPDFTEVVDPQINSSPQEVDPLRSIRERFEALGRSRTFRHR